MYKVIGTLDGKSSKTDDPRRGYPIYIYLLLQSRGEVRPQAFSSSIYIHSISTHTHTHVTFYAE